MQPVCLCGTPPTRVSAGWLLVLRPQGVTVVPHYIDVGGKRQFKSRKSRKRKDKAVGTVATTAVDAEDEGGGDVRDLGTFLAPCACLGTLTVGVSRLLAHTSLKKAAELCALSTRSRTSASQRECHCCHPAASVGLAHIHGCVQVVSYKV